MSFSSLGQFSDEAHSPAYLRDRGRVGDSTFAGLPMGQVTPRMVRAALVIMALFGVGTVALLPFASRPGMAMAGFVPAYQTVVFLLYTVSFLHLATYVRHTGAIALLHIAAGCLFSGLILLVQMFSFPIWGASQLVGSTSATTSWLWTFWHLGPTLCTFTYLFAGWPGSSAPMANGRMANRTILLSMLGVVLMVAAATAVSTLGLPWLPTIEHGDDYHALITSGVGPAVLSVTLLALGVLLVRTRCATQIDLYLAMSLALLAMDDVLTLSGSTRLSVGWYAGRAEAALSAAILLGLLLCEIDRRFDQVSARAALLTARQMELDARLLEQDETNVTLATLARQDGLTLLANRRTLDEVLALEWRRGRREHLPLTLLMVDVDHFKLYNDRLGHQAGDKCLRSVARLIQEVAGRPGDIAARYGGEEFALLLPATDLHGGRIIAEMLRTALRQSRIPHEAVSTGTLTISIGVACIIPDDERGYEALVAAADRALYRAKQSGRDRVVTIGDALFNPADVVQSAAPIEAVAMGSAS